jgi:uncharacterized protein YbaR (Trm112 family)
MVIVGWGGGEVQDLGEVAPTTCPNCHNHVYLHDIRSDKRVSLYFVPIFPYASNEYLACPICRNGLQIANEQRPSVDRMRSMTVRFRRGGVPHGQYQSAVARFWASLGVAPSGEQVLHPSPAAPPAVALSAAPAPASLGDQIETLAKLHADGSLTDGEFAAAKRRLLED